MKSSIFSKAFAGHVLSVFLVVSTILAVGNLAVAADINDQLSGGHHQKSGDVTRIDNNRSDAWEHDLQADGFKGARLLEAQFVPAPYCYTFAGPVCRMSVALPAGYSCFCPSSAGPLPGTTGF